MENTVRQNFLNDTLKNLIDRVIKIDAENQGEFEKGVQFGYYEVISHILNQADSFDIRNELDIYLQDFNPDDLLKNKAASPFKN